MKNGFEKIENYVCGIPKAELHLHIEGTFEPEMMFSIAKRNQIAIKYRSIDELKSAYMFKNLGEFLSVYYDGTSVLKNEQDFYDITYAYLKKASSQNIIHSEIFFDPQTHTNRGIKFETVIRGIHRAVTDAQESFGISTKVIMCFLRDIDPQSAMETLKTSFPFKDWIVGVGLDSAEEGHPPSSFQEVFEAARKEGYLAVAHAGEEGPAEYIWQALDLLKVMRVDHCIHCLDDQGLIRALIDKKIPLTVCPLSNVKLQVVKDLKSHPLKKMLNKGLRVTINSDDPAYFGGYLNENCIAVSRDLAMAKEDIYILARNAFEASFVDEDEKQNMIVKLEKYHQEN